MGQNWVKWVLDIRCIKRKAQSMKKTVKIVAVAIIILVIAVVPIYYSTRPASAPVGVILTVTGKVNVPLSITWDDLMSLQPKAVPVNLSSTDSPNEHGVFKFNAVSLGQVLQGSLPYPNATSVTFTGSKGQSTTMTLQEINQNLETMGIAMGKNDALFSSSDGPLRLFIPTDNNTDRWIKGLYSIVVN
jgi:DMSO/TMAO reductase YedYZ molybdopterin-dependent catalytic subunit